MKTSFLGVVMVASLAFAQPQTGPLSATDVAAGWVDLSGADASRHWRLLGDADFPSQCWSIDSGVLHFTPVPRSQSNWDLVSAVQYEDFEFIFDFKVAPGANSGVKYRVTDDATSAAFGPEFQVVDDTSKDAAGPKYVTGSLYDIQAPDAARQVHPAGEWNSGRILVREGVVQHWINGVKVVECSLQGKDWDAKIAESKFKDAKGFAQKKGRLALQDHGGEVWYRNLRVRDLKAKMPGEVTLFDGSSMAGWTYHLNDNGKMQDVWSIVDGVLVCKGNPVGYLRTEKDFTNFVLKLEWRFNPVTKQEGNSGVLLRMVGEDKVWPKSVEAQLQSKAAGDFWNIEEFAMKTDTSRLNGRNTKRTHTAERPVGEWNEYEIIVDHDKVTLKVNGEVLNQAWDVQEIPGKICLQSEGAEIHFRRIRLAPIP